MQEIWYPTPEHVAENNILILSILPAKKKDQPKVLSYQRLADAIAGCKEYKGDLYEKAAVLLVGIVKAHPFASGNRRTAFLTAKELLTKNGGKMAVPDSSEQARILIGIREGFYTPDEICIWIQHGKIRSFHR